MGGFANSSLGSTDAMLQEALRQAVDRAAQSLTEAATRRQIVRPAAAAKPLPPGDGEQPAPPPSVLRPHYPGVFTIGDEFFHTPYASSFLDLPFALLEKAAAKDGVVWLPFPGLGGFGSELERKLTLNSFVVWNLVHGEMLAIQSEGPRYRVPVTGPGSQETILVTVEDLGSDPAIEYANAGHAVRNPVDNRGQERTGLLRLVLADDLFLPLDCLRIITSASSQMRSLSS